MAAVHDETPLIALIAVGLAFAFVGGYVAVRLKLPPIIGYLLAGIAVGPFTPGFVGEPHLASELAEIGVILLMFGVGMHFSMEDLWAMRAIAVPGALIQIVAAAAMGAGVAALWGWPFGAGLVFGLALSVASTVVLLRALESLKAVHTPDGKVGDRLARGGRFGRWCSRWCCCRRLPGNSAALRRNRTILAAGGLAVAGNYAGQGRGIYRAHADVRHARVSLGARSRSSAPARGSCSRWR